MNNTILRIVRFLVRAIIPVLLFGLGSCSLDSASGTSETTNGKVITGAITVNDQLIEGASITIRSNNFLLDSSYINQTIEPDQYSTTEGAFLFDSILAGSYVLEFNYEGIYSSLYHLSVLEDQTEPINIGTIQLQTVSGFYGKINRENVKTNSRIFVQIYGLNKIALVDSSGEFMFSQLPSDNHVIRVFGSDSSYGTIDQDTISIEPAENIDVGTYLLPFEYWKDSVIIREILDSNNLQHLPIDSITEFRDGRLDGIYLSERREITMLPQSIKNLRVKRLLLANCNVMELPIEIGELKTLAKLILKNNNMDILPNSLSQCSQLKHLDISKNNIATLPEEVVSLTKFNSNRLLVAGNKLKRENLSKAVEIWLDTYAEPNWDQLQQK